MTRRTQGPLYDFLLHIFPLYRTERNTLKIPHLAHDLKLSRERIYQWLRADKMATQNATAVLALANSPDNAAAIKTGGGTPPELRDFEPFVYGE